MMASEYAETCRFININKLVVFDVPCPLLIVTYTTGMPQLRIVRFVFPEHDSNTFVKKVGTSLTRNTSLNKQLFLPYLYRNVLRLRYHCNEKLKT